jgi:hypothetical protein
VQPRTGVWHLQYHSFSAQDSVAPPTVESDKYFLVGNSFVALVGSERFDCYSKKDWGDFSTLHIVSI